MLDTKPNLVGSAPSQAHLEIENGQSAEADGGAPSEKHTQISDGSGGESSTSSVTLSNASALIEVDISDVYSDLHRSKVLCAYGVRVFLEGRRWGQKPQLVRAICQNHGVKYMYPRRTSAQRDS